MCILRIRLDHERAALVAFLNLHGKGEGRDVHCHSSFCVAQPGIIYPLSRSPLIRAADFFHLPDATRAEPGHPRSPWYLATGVFFLVGTTYVLSSPGRIDMIDGQVRYEAVYNWVMTGRPILLDPVINDWSGVRGRNGFFYSYFGAGASVAAPLVWLGSLIDDPPGEASRFFFSLTSGIFGALTAAVLYLFYVELGISERRALGWAMVNAFGTLLWPSSNSSYDNAQHAFFLLLAVFLGYRSATRRSNLLAAWGGLVGGALILYQEYFLLLIPALAISTLVWPASELGARTEDPQQTSTPLGKLPGSAVSESFRTLIVRSRAAFHTFVAEGRFCSRYGLFVGATGIGLGLSLAYNFLRFESIFHNGRVEFQLQRVYPLFGNPLAGFLTLLASPGKSIFLYSPPIILGLLGIRRLWRRQPSLGCTIVATSVILVLFISTIAFAGGDWCWGPRYLVPLLPLWALAMPFVPMTRFRRWLLPAIISAGLAVQVLGVSMENQRFFFERGLADFFWADDPWFYFKHSALSARVDEVISLRKGVPETARFFNPGPYLSLTTYTILGPPPPSPRRLANLWMRWFKVFYMPKPWPIWMPTIPPERRPINLEGWLGGALGTGLLGLALICRGLGVDWL